MSKNELQVLFDSAPARSYKDKITHIEEFLATIADGVNIVIAKPEDKTKLVYPDFWKYKHSFGDGIYIREVSVKKGSMAFSAIHKHSYGFFLLSGVLASSKEECIEEFVAPCYIISPRGTKRVVYAIEDCVVVTTHANPTNTQDLKEIEDANVVFSWKEYEEYLKKNKL